MRQVDCLVKPSIQRTSLQKNEKEKGKKMFDKKRKFEIAITYQTVTPESVEIGDFDSTGYQIETETGTLEDILDYVKSYGPFNETACYPICPHCWFINSECAQDRAYFEQGEETTYCLHVKNVDGSDLTQKEIEFMFLIVSGKKEIDFD